MGGRSEGEGAAGHVIAWGGCQVECTGGGGREE